MLKNPKKATLKTLCILKMRESKTKEGFI
jgi:hypothetical protein